MSTSKPRILVTRAIFQSVIDRLSAHFEVESNPDDVLWDRAELERWLEAGMPNRVTWEANNKRTKKEIAK